MKKSLTQKLITAGMLASFVCVATMIIKIPSPLNGYIHLGDGVVLIAGWLMPPVYGFWVAGIGAALADLFSGYTFYAPVTFLIKGIVACGAYWLFGILRKRRNEKTSRIFSGILAEVMMVLGYFAFECILYGGIAAMVNVPPNILQAVTGVAIGTVLIGLFQKHNLFK